MFAPAGSLVNTIVHFASERATGGIMWEQARIIISIKICKYNVCVCLHRVLLGWLAGCWDEKEGKKPSLLQCFLMMARQKCYFYSMWCDIQMCKYIKCIKWYVQKAEESQTTPWGACIVLYIPLFAGRASRTQRASQESFSTGWFVVELATTSYTIFEQLPAIIIKILINYIED